MKRWMVPLAAATLTMALACASMAQGGGQPGGGGQGRFGQNRGGFMMRGGLNLLRNETVQKELGMTQPQIEKIQPKQQELRTTQQQIMQDAGGFQAMQNLTPEERQKLMDKIRAAQNKAVADILDTKQQKRFAEIELQANGPQAFTQTEVATKLQLTADQKSKIRQILADMQQKRRDAMQGMNFQNMTEADRTAMQTKNAELNKTTQTSINGVLTEPQLKSWKTMCGQPFDTSKLNTFGPGGGGRRGGQGGQG